MISLKSLYFIVVLLICISLYQFKKIQYQAKLLNKYENMRKRLYETSKIISKENDEEKIYSIVLDTIIELIPNATNGSVLLYDTEEKFFYKVIKGFQKDLEKFSFKKKKLIFIKQINLAKLQ